MANRTRSKLRGVGHAIKGARYIRGNLRHRQAAARGQGEGRPHEEDHRGTDLLRGALGIEKFGWSLKVVLVTNNTMGQLNNTRRRQ